MNNGGMGVLASAEMTVAWLRPGEGMKTPFFHGDDGEGWQPAHQDELDPILRTKIPRGSGFALTVPEAGL